jgi:DNA gyrase subunit B
MKLTDREKKNINEYAKQIKTIENFAEAVRKTPGQYIGYIGNKGHINMIREVFQNSMDELQKDDSPCTEVHVSYRESDNTCIIEDNGRGIPFDNMWRIYASQHTSSNYTKKPGEFSAGRHGVGAKVTNALSSEFFVNSYMCKEVSADGKAHARRVEFREGIYWKNKEKVIPNPNNFQGTIVEFRPSYQIMGNITTTCEDVMELIATLLPLMKIGAIVKFHGEKNNGSIIDKTAINESGIVAFLVLRTNSPLIAPIVLSRTTGNMKADIAFTYDSNSLKEEDILSFANTCPTINNSTHVIGFLDGLFNYFKPYMNKIFLGKNSKLNIINNDIRVGLKAVVSVSHIEPMFSGQAKEIFSNKDIIPFIKDLMKQGLDEWAKANDGDLQKLCKYFKDIGNLRLKSDKDRVELSKKYVSTLTGLPKKYEKPIGKEHLEFILVEGDSAMGNARLARDPERQGILPLRGKPANAMSKSHKEFFENEECQAIYNILGCGEGKKCDSRRCKFEKIIFLGDADMDGLHIRTLLLKMFLVYYRPLVEEGRVYGAVPPLYSLMKGKERIFLTDKLAYIKYIYSKFSTKNEVLNHKGKKIPTKELNNILYDNSNYVQNLEIVSENYAIDPYLLEYTLSIRNNDYRTIKRLINKRYKFLDVKHDNGIIVFDGLADDKIQTVIWNQQMMNACSEIIPNIDNCPEPYFVINGTTCSLYGLLKIFEKYTPSSIQRYKGLGEMSAYELKISTLHPKYDRTLIRYTTDNIEKELEEIREIESNKSLLLKGINIAKFEL